MNTDSDSPLCGTLHLHTEESAPHDGGSSHLWTVAAHLAAGMWAALCFQPGHRECAEEGRGPGESVRLLSGHAPAASPGGQENVSLA